MVVQLPHQNFAAIKKELDIGFRELGVILTPDQRSSPVVYTTGREMSPSGLRSCTSGLDLALRA